MQSKPTQIYINPRFLNREPSDAEERGNVPQTLAVTTIPSRTKIMTHERRLHSSTVNAAVKTPTPLIRIGSRKLIRAVHATAAKALSIVPKIRKPIQTKYKIVKEQTAYKIDRRSLSEKRQKESAPTTQPYRAKWINEQLLPSQVLRCDSRHASSSSLDSIVIIFISVARRSPIQS